MNINLSSLWRKVFYFIKKAGGSICTLVLGSGPAGGK
jgi:hypothetical protein